MSDSYADPLPPVQALGVVHVETRWADKYTGSIEAVIAAGLVSRDRVPGAPGMNKVVVRLLPDGSVSIAKKRSAEIGFTGVRGSKRVERRGNRITVTVWLGGERRPTPNPAAEAELVDRVEEAVDRALRQRAAEYYLTHHCLPPWAPRGARRPRLRVVAGGGHVLPGPRRPAVLRLVGTPPLLD